MTDASPSLPSPLPSPLTITIPRVTTPRLLLREFRTADFPDYAENMADPVATEFLSGTVDRRTAWRMFLSASGSWVLHGTGWWSVELRETGECVGDVGVFLRETGPDLEIGWTLYRRFWGQGFAIEAAKAALAYAFERHRAKRVIAHITALNTASVAVSRKLGMTYETDVDFFGEPIGRYAIEQGS
jgi:RimJ/RimL family protein N-acetyltransferase